MDITKLNLTELKSLAYDQMATIEQSQNNLKAINEQIAKRIEDEKNKLTKVEDE